MGKYLTEHILDKCKATAWFIQMNNDTVGVPFFLVYVSLIVFTGAESIPDTYSLVYFQDIHQQIIKMLKLIELFGDIEQVDDIF